MQIFPSLNQFQSNPASAALLTCLRNNESSAKLTDAILYHSFPLYRDEEGSLIVGDAVLLSPIHGVVAFAMTAESSELEDDLQRCRDVIEQVPSYIHSRLVKNRALRSGPTRLAFEITPIVYGPLLNQDRPVDEIQVLVSDEDLLEFLAHLESDNKPLANDTFKELVATIDGAKGLIRPKKRDLPTADESSKGKQAELVEAAITLFDHQQKYGIMSAINGPQRIRGLAGSGKTVVLAMMAAQLHLKFPDARIAYTFYTKSLYQHVKRLITRFYRQFDDRDPDWDRNLNVLHGWGGSSNPGIYSVACEEHGIVPLSYSQTSSAHGGDRFDYACSTLLNSTNVLPIYDYILVDEGQDFPSSFVRLCARLTKGRRFVLAYDDLQTIFQAVTPSTADIFGTDSAGKTKDSFEEDIVLHKCYRNPREVLVAAHALGFGIYGERIVQMLESPDHWEDIGYVVKEGDFQSGSRIVVERPVENSLTTISDRSGFDEIISAKKCKDFQDEVAQTAIDVRTYLEDGLRPEDILIVCVDDRYAKSYLSKIECKLSEIGVRSNNLHSDSFGVRDFSKEGRVTLSTVHKAKGKEAFMVFVVGVDAVLTFPGVRKRNMLFTAMTRAKGWVRVTGVGDGATRFMDELREAKANFPSLVFTYPAPEELKIMKRDLAEAADKKLKIRRLLETIREDLSDEEIEELLRESKKSRSSRRKKH